MNGKDESNGLKTCPISDNTKHQSKEQQLNKNTEIQQMS